jgi:hypothetical protein
VGAASLTCVPDNSQLLALTIAGVEGEYQQHASVVGSTINCPGTCAASFVNGTDVTLSVVPDTLVSFVGWSGACSGIGACTVSLDEDQSVTATFAPVTEQTLTVRLDSDGLPYGPANGMGSVTSTPAGLDCHIPDDDSQAQCSATFPAFSEVTLHAEPSATPYYFDSWGQQGPCDSTGTSPDCTLRMDSDQTVSALFQMVALQVALPQCVSGAECGSARITDTTGGDRTIDFESCFGCGEALFLVPAGTVATLTVTTGPKGIFDGWGDDCAGTTGNVCVLTVTRFSAARVLVTEIFEDE